MMSGNDFLNKNVLRWRWRVDRDVAGVISSDSWFHFWGPETENARLPIVDSFTAGTVRRLVTAERKASRPGRSATRTKWSQISRCHTIHDRDDIRTTPDFNGNYGGMFMFWFRILPPRQLRRRPVQPSNTVRWRVHRSGFEFDATDLNDCETSIAGQSPPRPSMCIL